MTQKGFAPIIIVIILAVAAVGGYLIYQKQTKTSLPAQPSPNLSNETAAWKTYTSDRLKYSIKIPSDYIFKEDQQNGWEQFYLPKKSGNGNDYFEKQIVIWNTDTSDTDPCNPGLVSEKTRDELIKEELIEFKCITVNNLAFREVIVTKKNPRNYSYTTIQMGKNYHIGFTNVEVGKINQILSTFKFLSQ